jgi:hypothetical protein
VPKRAATFLPDPPAEPQDCGPDVSGHLEIVRGPFSAFALKLAAPVL